ncbi:MAG: putative outer rane lipoprotein [Chlorobi bacterium]|nr:putative outer rane lipoprotein [Chlorobiota bacterium]
MLLSMACAAFGQNDSASAKSAPLWYVGGFGGFLTTIERVDLTVPGFDECGTFRKNGAAIGAGGTVLVEFPITRWLSFQARPGFVSTAGRFREAIRGDHPVALLNGEIVPAEIDQQLDFTTVSLGLSALLRWAVTGGLRAQGGIALEHQIRATQEHKEIAISPADLLFGNNSRELGLTSGTIFKAPPLLLGLEAGLAYDLPISAHSTLSPEISAIYPLTSRATNGDWRTITFRVGAALRFGIGRPEVPVRHDTVDTARVPQASPPPLLATSITTDPASVTVRIDEYDSTEVLPLLNQVFFAEGSAALRDEYRQLTPLAANTFTRALLLGSALDVYYNFINLIGLRMRETPGATLTINGYRNSRESDPGLALRRAERVKSYFTDVWNIPSRRIVVAGGGLPPNPAKELSREGLEENARVEILSSDPNILGPHRRRHVQRIATPPAISFFPHTVAEAGVARWNLQIYNEDRGMWRTFGGIGSHPDSIFWNWRSDAGDLPDLPMRLRYKLSVTDNTGHDTATDARPIDVTYQAAHTSLEHRERDTIIESFSILLFNFDSPRVSPSDQELLRAIAAGVRHGANVRFVGYTDSLGGVEHNRALATQRAREAARIFQKLVPRDVSIVVDEHGGERERFPYATPEGRSHCRTVIIEVRTPDDGKGS